MTDIGTPFAAFLAAGAVAAGGVLGAGPSIGPWAPFGAVGESSADSAPRTALVIDAAEARDGRDLIDPRLQAADAEIRVPRTSAEARTDVRYFAAQDYRVVVAGPRAAAAAEAAGVPALHASGLPGALAAAGR
jgi:hypothetical protein